MIDYIRNAGFSVATLVTIAWLALTPSLAAYETIEVNGTRLSYIEEGEGKPVLFVPPAIADLRIWEAQRRAVAPHYRFVSYTQRYYGNAPWPDNGEGFSAASHAADLAALIEALDLAPAHLVGWSYSGEVITLMGLKHPELVRSMVLFEPAIPSLIADLDAALPALKERGEMFAPAIAAVDAGDLERAVRLFLEAVFKLPPGGFDSMPAELRQMWLEQGRTIPAAMAAPKPAITCEYLGAIPYPTLILQGEETHAFYSLVAETMAGCLPGSERQLIGNANHGGPMLNGDAVNAAILDFLEQH